MARPSTVKKGYTKPSRADTEVPEELSALVAELEARDTILRERSSDPSDGNPEDGDLAADTGMLYMSDGTGTGSDGDLVVAGNLGGTVQTAVVQARSGMS